jgi:hypothetical protein
MAGENSPSRSRLLLGFATLPVVDAGVALLVLPRGLAVVVAVVGVVMTVAGAVPVVYWLMRAGRLRLMNLLLAGLALGNAPFAWYIIGLILPFTLMHLVMGTLWEHLLPFSLLIAGSARAVAIGSFFGVLSAAVFWLVTARRLTA